MSWRFTSLLSIHPCRTGMKEERPEVTAVGGQTSYKWVVSPPHFMPRETGLVTSRNTVTSRGWAPVAFFPWAQRATTRPLSVASAWSVARINDLPTQREMPQRSTSWRSSPSSGPNGSHVTAPSWPDNWMSSARVVQRSC
jgi:hypothetical protein